MADEKLPTAKEVRGILGERDPRFDPRVGDVIHVGGGSDPVKYRVLAVIDDAVIFEYAGTSPPSAAAPVSRRRWEYLLNVEPRTLVEIRR